VVAAAGVMAPRAYGVEEIEGRWGVVMDRVEGRPFAEPMLADMAGAGPYFAAMARLQASLHAGSGAGLRPLKPRLAAKLDRAPGLDGPVRERLRERLADLPDGDRLLHGDFHPFNILGTLEAPVIVDWLDATCGPPAADVCRSWVLMMAAPAGAADAYLEACLAAGELTGGEVFAWLPVIAGARLTEQVPEQEADLRRWAEMG